MDNFKGNLLPGRHIHYVHVISTYTLTEHLMEMSDGFTGQFKGYLLISSC